MTTKNATYRQMQKKKKEKHTPQKKNKMLIF